MRQYFSTAERPFDGGAKAALPDIDVEELEAACRRMSEPQARVALRTRVVPLSVSGQETTCVVDSARAAQYARRCGYTVAARTRPQTMMLAFAAVFGEQILHNARFHLASQRPELSARRRMTTVQWVVVALLFSGLAAGLIFAPQLVAKTLWTLFAIFFIAVVSLRGASLWPGRPPRIRPKERYRENLPVYTVLVPLYDETEVLDQLVAGLEALRYPPEKLDIKLILEENDQRTRDAVAAMTLPAQFEAIVVPSAKPQTKPKALNYALHFARGDFVVIYDAEDIPEPDQLLKAVDRFAASSPDLVCLQARLTFANANENWLTRQFTIEYAVLFELILPFLASLDLPLPLGGTSNHFKMSALRKLGMWDPFNVTEDADLGIRLARFGWRSGVLDSSTYEEANNQVSNWIPQRSRWLKGWIQTWFVHMRNPVLLWRELGAGGFLVVQAIMAGVVISTIAHPLFTVAAGWSLFVGLTDDTVPTVFSILLASTGFVVLVTGYGISLAAGFVALKERRLYPLWPSVLAMPIYWLLISIGGWIALKEFITAPHHWNKTRHGLTRIRGD